VGKALALPLYRTDDGGVTWVQVHTDLLLQSPQYGQLHGVHFVDLNNGFAYYDGALLQKTTDGGHTWSVAS
jgi:photosystem II stability/assembly factor-like uncharacterized protein